MTGFGLPALRLGAFAGDTQIPNLAKKPAEANKAPVADYDRRFCY